MRILRSARSLLVGLPVSLMVVYALSTALNLSAFLEADLGGARGDVGLAISDLGHTVGSSYGYLFGHVLDFYDYNSTYFIGNDYLPTTYVIFAIWMAPVTLLLSPGVQHASHLSSIEIAWAKVLLLLFFLAAFVVVSKIAKELFPTRPRSQIAARIAFLLSPFAAFAFNVVGQYDVIGVFFAALGFLFYLRGEKWRFAIAIAISSKYFALLIFLPLLVLQFKRVRELVPLLLVGASVTVAEALLYLPNAAFRDYTLLGLVSSKASTAESTSPAALVLVGIVYVGGLVVVPSQVV